MPLTSRCKRPVRRSARPARHPPRFSGPGGCSLAGGKASDEPPASSPEPRATYDRVVAELPHVVIVGGGFGGLYAARALRGARIRLTVVDRRNYHVFQPLLYQVAMAALSEGDIASPIRWILRRQS